MIALLFAAYFSLLMGGSNGTVLCLGENGHIAIELSKHAPCGGSDPGIHRAETPVHKTLQSYISSYSSSCIDFFLPQGHSYLIPPSAQKKASSNPAKSVSSHQRDPLCSRMPQRILPLLSPLSEQSGRAMLSTIVLLI